MSRGKVIHLEKIQDADEVGAKALSLARMKSIGLPVPSAFCVLASAYREHLTANNLVDELRSELDLLARRADEEKRDILSDIRRRITDASMDEQLSVDIKDHYSELTGELVAVRSSATVEDLPGHSFAGQYDTYLGLAGLADCIAAIKKCWASLWTERAYEYRKQNGFDHLEADMAVIVQELVPAEAAGVIFTVDPTTGSSDRLIIEACFGMGDSVVSGKVTPDRFTLAKADLSVISHSVSEKVIRNISDEQGTDLAQSNVPCIDEAMARRLGVLAKKAESAFGSPQDIEWAVKVGDIFFLQSRPITTLPPTKSWEDRQVWSNFNVGEACPEPVTPMTFSFWKRVIKAAFTPLFHACGLDPGDTPVLGLIAGRVYQNLNTWAALYRSMPFSKGIDWEEFTQLHGGDQEKMAASGQLEILEEDIPDLGYSLSGKMIGMPVFLFRALLQSTGRGKRNFADMLADRRKRTEEFRQIDLSSLSDDELATRLNDTIEDSLDLTTKGFFAVLGVGYVPVLDKICTKWLGDATIANRLLAGMGGMDSAESGLDLWRLAAKAKKHADIEQAVLSGNNWETTRRVIAGIRDGGAFLSGWDKFMEKHGHHVRGGFDLINACWREVPDYILDMIRGCLGNFADPVENHRRRAEERKELEKHCRRKLRNPFKRMIFNFCLKQAQQGSLTRDNFRNASGRQVAPLRSIILELGARFERRGLLEDRDDIFFLSLDELDPVRQESASFNVKEIVTARRADHDRNSAITPPRIVTGRFDPDNYVPDAIEETAESLNGLAVSPGVVVGPARVILKVGGDEQVLPGEILVAPFTDPAWTPYFILAAAIVVDQGGILSHGSVVAREYGIPTVVNVGTATRIIKTGQIIQVDGTRGVVKILRDLH